jgi:endonuclease YncB( thermonuclease family)
MHQYIYKAKVTKVHSGDSFKADVDLGFGKNVVAEFSLLGVKAPSMTLEVEDDAEKEKENPSGVASKKKLEELIGGREVLIDVQKRGDSYAARVTIPGVVLPINDYMLRYGLAVMKRN